MTGNAECSVSGGWWHDWEYNNGSIQAQDTSVYTAAALQHCSTADIRLFWCFVNFILNQKRGALRMIDARHGPARNQINH